MSPTPGIRIGPYEVIAPIGEGGMGRVYRAMDTNLKRTVAIKVLAEAVAADAERIARFQREAEVLARLNHPNIAQIHGLEKSEDTIALVMELVEGDTLADRIARGPIPLDEAVPIARQIVEAVEAAHEQGIIHRDLKPANIKLRADGAVKVLDFGLAKALEPVAAGADATVSPTITNAAMTQAGVILGTAAYMSPEQARGRQVDKRADIWAFGCVLYEMLTGRRAFPGDDVPDTLAGILRGEPNWDAVPPQTPPTLVMYLKRCLHKDPRQRVHDVADIRLALDGAFDTVSSSITDRRVIPSPSGRRGWPSAATAVAGAVAGSILTGLLVWSITRPVTDGPARFAISLSSTGWQENPNGPALVAFSPSGRTIVYAARNALYRRDLGRLALEVVPGTEATLDNINTPFFSPDGQWIGYWQAGAIKKVALSGGAPSTILQAVPRGASWGAEDTIVFGSNTGLFRVSANGGQQPEKITTLTEGEVGHHRPEVLPGGDGVIFTVWRGSIETAQIAVVSLRTGQRRTLLSGTYPRYSPSGHLVFAREESLWAVPFDLDRLEVSGTAVPVLDGARIEAFSGVAQFAIAANGSLVYVTATSATRLQRLVWVDRMGREEPLRLAPGPYSDQRVSPDGTRVAMTVASPDNLNVSVLNLAGGNPMRLTFEEGPARGPLWTRDNARLVFHSGGREGGLFWKAADGTGPVEPIMKNPDRPMAQGWSRDGQLVFNTTSPGAQDIGVVPVKGGQPAQMIINTASIENYATVSPDGQWLAYQSNESGRNEIYVRRLPDVIDKWQVSLGGGVQPLWSPNGRELFYRTAESLMTARVQPGPAFSTEAPQAIFGVQNYSFPQIARSYDVSPDGRRFLMLKPEASTAGGGEAAPELIFVENWTEELKLAP